MINRRTLLVDRAATLIVAVALIAGAVVGIWWWSGESPLPGRTETSSLTSITQTAWWPWASGAVGVVLILLALRWMVAHLGRNKVKHLTLSGSNGDGKLSVVGGKAAGAAADAFADTLGVRDAKGSVTKDRGQIVAHISAIIEPDADLALIATQADLVSSQLATVLGRDDLRCSVELKVARRGAALPRVT